MQTPALRAGVGASALRAEAPAKPGRSPAGGDFFFKTPLSNGVYSAKNARRYSVIKIQRAQLDGFFLCWLASRLSGPETAHK
jgi:hypothetical protein